MNLLVIRVNYVASLTYIIIVTPVHNQTNCTTLHKKFKVGHLIYIDTE